MRRKRRSFKSQLTREREFAPARRIKKKSLTKPCLILPFIFRFFFLTGEIGRLFHIGLKSISKFWLNTIWPVKSKSQNIKMTTLDLYFQGRLCNMVYWKCSFNLASMETNLRNQIGGSQT